MPYHFLKHYRRDPYLQAPGAVSAPAHPPVEYAGLALLAQQPTAFRWVEPHFAVLGHGPRIAVVVEVRHYFCFWVNDYCLSNGMTVSAIILPLIVFLTLCRRNAVDWRPSL
jgi:hypothetical protein